MEASAVSPWTMVWEDSSISYLLLPPPMRDLITRAASTMSTRPRADFLDRRSRNTT